MKVGPAWYVQAGSHGEKLARISVTIDRSPHRVEAIESELLPAAAYKPDPECFASMREWLARSAAPGSRTIRHLDRAISARGMPGHDCHMSAVISRAIAAKTQVGAVSSRHLVPDTLVERCAIDRGNPVRDDSIMRIRSALPN